MITTQGKKERKRKKEKEKKYTNEDDGNTTKVGDENFDLSRLKKKKKKVRKKDEDGHKKTNNGNTLIDLTEDDELEAINFSGPVDSRFCPTDLNDTEQNLDETPFCQTHRNEKGKSLFSKPSVGGSHLTSRSSNDYSDEEHVEMIELVDSSESEYEESINILDGYTSNDDVIDLEGIESDKLLARSIRGVELTGFSPLHLLMSGTNFKSKLNALLKQGIKRTMGKWRPDEIKKLNENMKEFLANHDVKDFIGLILMRTKEDKAFRNKSQFCLKMCQGIQRTGSNILARTQRQFSNFLTKGRFSKKELEELKQLHDVYGDNWKQIGLHLNRNNQTLQIIHNESLLKKWNRGEWSFEEKKNLISSVIDLIDEDGKVGWRAVSAEMGTRSPLNCGRKWRREFSHIKNRKSYEKWLSKSKQHDDDKINESFSLDFNEIYKLITLISDSNIDDEYLIDWDELTKHFDQVDSPSWLKWKFKSICKEVPRSHMIDFPDIIEQLYEIYEKKFN